MDSNNFAGIPPIQSESSTQPVRQLSPAEQQARQAEAALAILEKKSATTGLIKTIVIIILALVSVTFVGLFVWMNLQ